MNRYFLHDNGAIIRFSNLPPLTDKEAHEAVDWAITFVGKCEEINFIEYHKRSLAKDVKCFIQKFKK